MEFHPILPRFLRPSVYQGKRKAKNYFEGWYFKLVDPRGANIWSIIPGVSYSEDSHCFIQVIHANSGNTSYHRYPLDQFSFKRDRFQVGVGDSIFSSNEISLQIDSPELHISGSLDLKEARRFPSSLRAPGIMGWYSYAPFMECYHGVVSMQHQLEGSLQINGTSTSFDGGKGYIEKDWGRSMPSDWIWMQSNHFEKSGETSFMISLARIPWLNGFFPGFLSFLLLDEKVYRFATYNRSRISHVEIRDDVVSFSVSNRRYQLNVKAWRKESGILKAPRHGNMDRDIQESVVSSLELELRDAKGALIYQDRGRFAGLEIVGNVARYFQDID
jgi:hypothetical protein